MSGSKFALPVCGLLLISMTGCSMQSTPNAVGANAVFARAKEHNRASVDYVIDPPDEIQITSRNVKELENVHQSLRPDGKLSLALLGEVQVSGMTASQARYVLNQLAAKYYGSPDVQVNVEPKSKFFTIFGRGVNQPRKIAFTGNDSVVRALAEAGMNDHAWPQQILLVRPPQNPGEQPARAVVDFKHMQQTGDTSQNYVVNDGDIITVRGSPLDDFNFTMVRILGPISGAQTIGGGVRGFASPSGS